MIPAALPETADTAGLSSLSGEGWSIRRGDSRALIAGVPDQSVDLILTDPPYNLGNYSTGNMDFAWRKSINNDIAAWDKFSFMPEEWAPHFTRILKPAGTIFAFCSYNLMGDWHRTFDPLFDTFQFMVWHKTNPAPKFRRAGFLNSCELIVCLWNKGHIWNFTRQSEMHNHFESPICMGKERWKKPHHPTQKPVKLLTHLIRLASRPGALIFDPFMGTGSTGVASLKQGCNFLGFEAEQGYFNAASERLKMQALMTPAADPSGSPAIARAGC